MVVVLLSCVRRFRCASEVSHCHFLPLFCAHDRASWWHSTKVCTKRGNSFRAQRNKKKGEIAISPLNYAPSLYHPLSPYITTGQNWAFQFCRVRLLYSWLHLLNHLLQKKYLQYHLLSLSLFYFNTYNRRHRQAVSFPGTTATRKPTDLPPAAAATTKRINHHCCISKRCCYSVPLPPSPP